MRRIQWLLVLIMLLPQAALALNLRWSTGSTDLSVSENTRALLILQADSLEQTLPPSWRLQWIADSSGIRFVAVDSALGCQSDTARVGSLDEPSAAAERVAGLVTAHFCSGSEPPVAIAAYLVDLGAGSRGRLRAIALNSTDSSAIVESNAVTYNGGVDGRFAPVILFAGRSHSSTELRVSAVGAGLDGTSVIRIAAPDTSWHVALNVTDHTTTSLAATAQVAADLPPFFLEVGDGSSGAVTVAPLDADTASVLSVQPACVDFMKEINLITHEQIQPKDFAIVTSRDSFHLFYIRHDMNLSTDATEKIIGHKRSRNLNDWFPTENTMTAISARIGTNLWDNYHVWAPTIIRNSNGDPTYYMLYTGVQLFNGLQIQRIGVATSTDLNIWTQDTTWIWEPKRTSWAEPDSTTIPGQQFRDPFVMPDPNPDSTGHYLMFLVGGSKDRHPRMVVGVARTIGPVADFRRWYDVGPLWSTDAIHSGAAQVESPHALKDPGGLWSLYYTGYNFGAPNDSAFVSFEVDNATTSYPADLDTTKWSAPDTLYKALGGDQTLQFWHGSEYLNWAPGYEYLGAYDDNQHAVDISEISWRSSHTYVLNDSCPPAVALGVDPKSGHLEFALSLLGARPSHVPVAFAVETPTKARMRLTVYDVLGRRVQTVLDEEVLPGKRELRWDGRGATGDAVGPGIYFARLTSAAGQRIARVVLLR